MSSLALMVTALTSHVRQKGERKERHELTLQTWTKFHLHVKMGAELESPQCLFKGLAKRQYCPPHQSPGLVWQWGQRECNTLTRDPHSLPCGTLTFAISQMWEMPQHNLRMICRHRQLQLCFPLLREIKQDRDTLSTCSFSHVSRSV